jgi:hypothetical protein
MARDTRLRSPGEQVKLTRLIIEEYIRCREDILYFAENYFYIVSIDEGRHKIKLRHYQKKILKALMFPEKNKRNNIIAASRQIGKSTLMTIYALHYMLFNDDKTVAILANKEKTAKEILEKIKLAYAELPKWLQKGVLDDGWAAEKIKLENGTRVIASSTASSAIRGMSISLLLLDEFAFVPNNIADDFMSSVYPTISSGNTSKIIIVSTPNGLNHFYQIWKSSVRNENSFMPIKVSWKEIPGRTKKWADETIRDIGIQKFNQEYAVQFLGSSNTLIDPSFLERMTIEVPVDVKLGSLMSIYEPPRTKGMYICGVDSAKGTQGDYSVVQVIRIMNERDIKQVAIYRCNTIDPLSFAQVVISISQYYNNAYLMIESNDVGSQVANSIFYEHEYDYILNCDKKGLGILATRKSKLAGVMMLKRYIENGSRLYWQVGYYISSIFGTQ